MDLKRLEDLVATRAPNAANAILKAAASSHNEAEFRTQATRIIEEFANEADLNLSLREEYTLLNGRADAVYNRFVIEYESPGSLRRENRYQHNQHAIEQVKTYLSGLVHVERHKVERLAGVAFDGGFYIFIRQKDKTWHIEEPVPVNPASTERFLRTLASLSTERALIPENLVEDFGENCNIARRVVGALYNALKGTDHPRAKVLFDQWARQFSEVCDYDQASKINVMAHAKSYGVNDKSIRPFPLFFCIHSYYALLIKLLAVQIVHYYLMPRLGTDLRRAATLSSDKLKRYLSTIEDGGIFRQLGINNFVEGDLFRWYLDCWNPETEGACRSIITTLSEYAIDTLDIDPDATRDLLKQLYQNLMPKPLRHNLGEYYTPDWLAERLLNQLEAGRFEGNPKKRLLDPACGSGTFLFLTIRKMIDYGWEKSIPERQLLEMILENVVGFDLNPLAVISARTNYLLALGNLLQHRSGEINIPVYLCDSIQPVTQESADLFHPKTYSFPTAVGTFTIPSNLVDARYIELLASLLEESIKVKFSDAQFIERVLGKFPLQPEKDKQDVDILLKLYHDLLELDKKQINGIWARIIKNAFAPIFAGRFDYVAGNPPWVNWSSLPDEYRQRTSPLWVKYGLFPHSGLRARLGSAMDDISILMLYVAVDKYLNKDGKLGFVITQTIFKSEGGGQGFRRLKIGDNGSSLCVIWVDDMSSFQVFDGPSNRTAVIILDKRRPTRYPIGYGYWRKTIKGKAVPVAASLQEVLQMSKVSMWQARPIKPEDVTSPWFTGRPKSYMGVKKVLGESSFQARMGVHCHGNGAYWLDFVAARPDGLLVVSNVSDAGRIPIDSVQVAIESNFVYPLLRGKDVSQWLSKPRYLILIPHDQANPSTGVSERILKTQYPQTYKYLSSIESFLRSRSGYKQFFEAQGAPYWSLYNVGPYTFAPYKLVWRYIASDFTTAVVSSAEMPDGSVKTIIPETKLVLIPFEDEMAAHFLCAQLASSIARFAIMSYIVNIQMATHVTKYLKLQQYDMSHPLHQALANASKSSHAAAFRGDTGVLRECELKVDALSAELWGLTDAELQDVQSSLADIQNEGVKNVEADGETT